MQDVFCSVKKVQLIEVTIKRKVETPQLKLYNTSDGTGNETTVIANLHTFKLYYNENGELLAERDVTIEKLGKVTDIE